MDKHGLHTPQRRKTFHDNIQMLISQYDASFRIIKRLLMHMVYDVENQNAFLLDQEETVLEPRKEDAQNNDDVIFLFERQSAVGEDHTDEVARTYAQNDDDVIFLFERQSAVGEDHTDEVARTLSDQHAEDDVIFLFERRPAVEEPRPRPPPCARMRTGKH
ncbi:PREDICTED: uncharacterized protein LOC109464224 isoform X1 [Branchiostoma belcheri]|uniref:Uncharacterized protein LOC109464224 isoform X1 n=1 Tax=Branchiostoma belcheri TaxID=7741 RepID=A0A6P4XX84_BRABE|nr:PREDICTED: uncharacterized protein LOC109464224 isoform X1 [Branchiostoma belcheri]XP_019616719.1 PREDICTED: uncharacterized protein LOC109464224 isoform X1 [Branchiostoma belcheri]